MSSGEAMTAPTYEVRPPSEVLAEDVICQSFIQSSSTLAYACLALRRGRYDLAAHVLHSLEQKPASRFKDMVLYLQAQIAIETGDFGAVKKRLASRAHQHPNDMVALGLLASAVFLEWEDWQRRNPAPVAHPTAGERTVPDAEDHPSEPDAGMPAYRTLPVPTVPSEQAEHPGRSSEAAPPSAHGNAAPASHRPFLQSAEADFGLYQALVTDANTQALSLWNVSTRKLRTACKNPVLESLVADLPEVLPSDLAAPIRSLEGGEIQKVCFSFQGLTVTSLHAGAENLGLVTGNMSQGLLTMVRAENMFLKAAPGAAAAHGSAGHPGAGNAARPGAAT